jgi:DNA polymerase-3 subunit epsilon
MMMEQCHGACNGSETSEDYNQRAILAKEQIQRVFNEDFIIVTTGRQHNEKGVILVENKHYQGFGYISTELLNLGIEEIKEAIDYKRSNVECNNIISTYLNTKDDVELIRI